MAPGAGRARQLAWFGVVGPAAFAVAAIVGAQMVEGYSHVRSFISELAATGSDSHGAMTVGFFALGISIVVFALSLRALRPAALLLFVVVLCSGVGTLMAGSFGCDRGCPASCDMTTHQQLHNVSSVITFSAWIVMAFVAARQLRGARFARVSLVLGVLELGIGLALASFNDRHPDDPVGLLQRALLLCVAVWFLLATLELRRDQNVRSTSIGGA